MKNWRHEKTKAYVLANLDSVEVYAYAKPFDGFHYKTFWITPHGALRLDTCGLLSYTKRLGLHIVKEYGSDLQRYTAAEIIANWKAHGWGLSPRVFEKQIVEAWEQGHE